MRFRVPQLRFFSVFAVVAIFLAANAPSTAAAPVMGVPGVNIRACPQIDCDVLAVAPLGEDLEIIGEEENGFVPVTWGNTTGFAWALYLSQDGTAPWLQNGDRSCKQVALIFNIGIGDEPSQKVLDTLIEKDAAATMFPMGWWAKEHPDYLKDLDKAGFPIGTHGDQMLFLTGENDATVRQDVLDSKDAIEDVLGHEIEPLWTPYAADTNEQVRTVVAGEGLLPVGWDVAAADYDETATEEGVYDRVMGGVTNGSIVEFHLDGPATDQSTALALPDIVDDLRADGYELVTVQDMIQPCGS